MITVDINAGEATKPILDAIGTLQDGRPLFQRIAATLESETESNFAAQGRPVRSMRARSISQRALIFRP